MKRIFDSGANGVQYADLFCDAMAFPLVTPTDLASWMMELEGSIEIRLEGSTKRRKPSPDGGDKIYLKDATAFRRFLK